MAIDPIQLTGLAKPALLSTEKAPATGFSDILSQAVGRLDGVLQTADAKLQAYSAGANMPVHEVMISMEKARIAMQFAVEVRNRVVEAYQEFMRMQV